MVKTKEQKYDLFDQDEIKGVYTLRELAERFQMSLSTLRVYASCGHLIKNRYRIERAITESQLQEWDKMRIAMLERKRRGQD